MEKMGPAIFERHSSEDTPVKWVAKEFEAIVAKVRHFQGLVCIVELEKGDIVYANDRVRYLRGIESGSPIGTHFFHLISAKDKFRVIEKFREIHRVGDSVECKLPFVIGAHEVAVNVQIATFDRGIILQIPDDKMIAIKEVEMEKLKVLILKYPKMGLWVVDETGHIVDVLGENCEKNLGWQAHEVLGRNISQFSAGKRGGEEYALERLHKRGHAKKTMVVEGSVQLSSGKTCYICLDTYQGS